MCSDRKPVFTHRTRGTTHVDTMEMKGDIKKPFVERLEMALSVQLRPTDSDVDRVNWSQVDQGRFNHFGLTQTYIKR